ncbi:hypothetical protein V1509DRAFT_619927 [Lipomyces kononenkoae]
MPRAPRRRKINLPTRSSRAAKHTISYVPSDKVIPPSVETSSQQSSVVTHPIPSSGLPSSPPRRGNRKRSELVIPDSEDDDAVPETLQEEEDDVADNGAEELTVGETTFLPRSTSTPKAGVSNIARGITQARRRKTRGNSDTILSQEIRPDAILSDNTKGGGLNELEADNGSTISSQSSTSDPFGFAKIRGIRIAEPLSSSPTRLSSVSLNECESPQQSRPDGPADPQSSPSPPSSPLSDLGKTPSPAKTFLTSLENPRDIESPIAAGRVGDARKSATGVKKGRKEKKKLNQVTTAQLTELLPQRPARRRRQRTRSLEFDDTEDSDTGTLVDSRPSSGRKRARSKQTDNKRRTRSNKENLGPIEVSKENGTKSKSVQRNPLDGAVSYTSRPGSPTDVNEEDIEDALSNEPDNEDNLDEQSTDSETIREMESERLRQKFKEVDEWNLEFESVPAQSDSSFL